MKQQFYGHLIEAQTIETELDSIDLSKEERKDLMHHVYSSVHYKIIDVILTEIPEEHKKTFLENLQNENHEKLWEHLFKNTKDIEKKITDASKKIISEFAEDVRFIKEKSKK